MKMSHKNVYVYPLKYAETLWKETDIDFRPDVQVNIVC